MARLLLSILAFGYLATSVIGGAVYELKGTTSFHQQPGETITVTASYKLCLPLYCPTCIRILYLNAGAVSTCIAKLFPSSYDCKAREVTAKIQVPSTNGVYDIRFSRLLEYNCRSTSNSNIGVKVGTVQVGSSSCEEGKTVYNECNEKCTCKDGELEDCTRIRKEFTALSADEQTRYVSAAKKIATDPRIKPAYDDLIYTHRILFPSIIHTKDMFLPWHRYFLLQYEDLLRQVDCRVNAIYWDWSAASQTNSQWNDNPGDVWYSGERGIGGDGACQGAEKKPCCVRSGVFKESAFSLVPGSKSTCLRREFGRPPPNSTAVQALLKVTDFTKFETTWRTMHNMVHCSIGGTMCTDDSASAPEFFFHHGFVDKFWGDWQDVSEENKNAFFPSVTSLMPRQGLYPKQLMDLKNQPGSLGPVRVEYEQRVVARRSIRKGKRKFPRAPQVPKGSLRDTDERAIRRLFNMSPEDVRLAEQTMRELQL